jgi:hypothetical protein
MIVLDSMNPKFLGQWFVVIIHDASNLDTAQSHDDRVRPCFHRRHGKFKNENCFSHPRNISLILGITNGKIWENRTSPLGTHFAGQ